MKVIGNVRIYHLTPEEFKKMHEDFMSKVREVDEDENNYRPTELNTAVVEVLPKRTK